MEGIMSVKIVVKKNTYFDSVSLMSISTRANKIDGVEQAFVAMATEMNKGVLKNLGLLTPELEAAKNGDLMIVINGQDGADNEQILSGIEALFSQKRKAASTKRAMPPSPALKNIFRTAIWRLSQSTDCSPPAKHDRRYKTVST
jgi:hypothetical protein